MLSPSYSISPKDLWNAIATRDATQLVDVRRRDAYEQSPHLLPGAVWRDAGKAKQWTSRIRFGPPDRRRLQSRPRNEPEHGRAIARRRHRCARAGRRLRGLDKSRPALRRESGARSHRAKTAEPMGDAAAAENRSHRLPLADPPFSRSAGAHFVRRSRIRWSMSRAKAAVCRSTSRMSNSATSVNAAHSTPCSNCSVWKVNPLWRGSP